MLEELKAKAKAALEAGDDVAFMAVVAEINKAKADIAKQQAVQALKDATELAGVREALELDIFKAVKALKIDKAIADVKAYGFTYKINRVDKTVEPELTIKETRAYMVVPMVKTPRTTGATGGKRGNLVEDYEKFKGQYATAKDVDIDKEYADALEKDKTVSNQGYTYNVKNKVRKWALAQGLLAPAK